MNTPTRTNTNPHTFTRQWKHPAIAEARDAALARLKPNEAQLEHGLSLHAESPVVESYGFSAFAAPDTAALQQAIKGGASSDEAQRIANAQPHDAHGGRP